MDYDEGLRTLLNSQATMRFRDQSHLKLRELTWIEIRHPDRTGTRGLAIRTNAHVLYLSQGAIRVRSRERTDGLVIQTTNVVGRPKGTEFLVSVDGVSGCSEVTMFDGEVELTSRTGSSVLVTNRQQGIVTADGLITVRPILQATNVVQWWIYYAAVLDPAELGPAVTNNPALTQSLEAYRSGDLVAALERLPGYPEPSLPVTEAERIYLASLHLGVGAVDRTEACLVQVATDAPLARALRIMIAAVSDRSLPRRPGLAPVAADELPRDDKATASELLALSYAHQSTNNLKGALKAARRAAANSPSFGFAWARVAELEFSFGRVPAAQDAVQRAIALSPRNAQAFALKGFLLATDNRIKDAIQAFEEARELDSGLGNAWLGLGLCKRRLGWWAGGVESALQVQESRSTVSARAHQPDASPADPTPSKAGATPSAGSTTRSWLSDRQAAAGVEPSRSLLRSYLGKGFSEAHDPVLARKELDYTRRRTRTIPRPGSTPPLRTGARTASTKPFATWKSPSR